MDCSNAGSGHACTSGSWKPSHSLEKSVRMGICVHKIEIQISCWILMSKNSSFCILLFLQWLGVCSFTQSLRCIEGAAWWQWLSLPHGSRNSLANSKMFFTVLKTCFLDLLIVPKFRVEIFYRKRC